MGFVKIGIIVFLEILAVPWLGPMYMSYLRWVKRRTRLWQR